jgi:hypothetical protein
MKSFKQYLLEGNFDTIEEYRRYLHKLLYSKIGHHQAEALSAITIDEEGKLECKVFSVELHGDALHNGKLPFPFADFKFNTFAYKEPNYMPQLKSFENFPERVSQNLEIYQSSCNDFTDAPSYVGKKYVIEHTTAEQLKNLKVQTKSLHLKCAQLKKVPDMKDVEAKEIYFDLTEKLESGFLQLAKVKGLESISFWGDQRSPIKKAFDLILAGIKAGDNIGKIQTSLFKKGFKEYATL